MSQDGLDLFLLEVAAFGFGDDEACLGCHVGVRVAIRKTINHALVGCSGCHATHPLGSPVRLISAAKTTHLLSDATPKLCSACHDLADRKLLAAHRGQPFQNAQCQGCHDPHGSDVARMIRSQQHPPFAGRQCDTCHAEPKAGKVVLKRSVAELCSTCHARILKRQILHEPVKTNCIICHNPHAGEKANLRAAVNVVCLECHSSQVQASFNGDAPVRLFGGQVTLAARPFQNLRLLELSNERGHPVSNHPVAWKADKNWPDLNCTTCHDPHGSDKSPMYLVTGEETPIALCQRCHK